MSACRAGASVHAAPAGERPSARETRHASSLSSTSSSSTGATPSGTPRATEAGSPRRCQRTARGPARDHAPAGARPAAAPTPRRTACAARTSRSRWSPTTSTQVGHEPARARWAAKRLMEPQPSVDPRDRVTDGRRALADSQEKAWMPGRFPTARARTRTRDTLRSQRDASKPDAAVASRALWLGVYVRVIATQYRRDFSTTGQPRTVDTPLPGSSPSSLRTEKSKERQGLGAHFLDPTRRVAAPVETCPAGKPTTAAAPKPVAQPRRATDR